MSRCRENESESVRALFLEAAADAQRTDTHHPTRAREISVSRGCLGERRRRRWMLNLACVCQRLPSGEKHWNSGCTGEGEGACETRTPWETSVGPDDGGGTSLFLGGCRICGRPRCIDSAFDSKHPGPHNSFLNDQVLPLSPVLGKALRVFSFAGTTSSCASRRPCHGPRHTEAV